LCIQKNNLLLPLEVMKNKFPKTQREIEFYCDKIVAERKVYLLQLQLAAINQVLKENILVPIKSKKNKA
jgi:hypothetical protein